MTERKENPGALEGATGKIGGGTNGQCTEYNAELATDQLFVTAMAVNSIKFPVTLNSYWRVTNDRLQWKLEVRQGNQRWKASGYRCRAFCVSRTGLLRCIREYCGQVYLPSVKLLEQLPDLHPDRRES